MSKLVAVTDTVFLRCKLCASEHREKINDLIAAQRSGDITREALFEQMEALGIKNPNLGNVKAHLGTSKKPGHIRLIPAAEKAVQDAAAQEVYEEYKAGTLKPPSADEILDLQLSQYERELWRKIEAGESIGFTHDHALKAIAEKTKRKHNEAQQEILGALTGGIMKAFERSDQRELPPGEDPPVVDAEVVEEEDAEEESE